MRRAERGGNDLAMLDDPKLTEMREYYDRGRELGRLGESYGQLEFERTKEIILRHLPPPPAVVADLGEAAVL